MWLVYFLCALVVYGIVMETIESKGHKQPKKRVNNNSQTAIPYVDQLIHRYNKAYDSNSEDELKSVVEDIIGYHYSCSSSKDYDCCIKLESLANRKPYNYKGDSYSCQGKTLIEILRQNNKMIAQRDRR